MKKVRIFRAWFSQIVQLAQKSLESVHTGLFFLSTLLLLLLLREMIPGGTLVVRAGGAWIVPGPKQVTRKFRVIKSVDLLDDGVREC